MPRRQPGEENCAFFRERRGLRNGPVMPDRKIRLIEQFFFQPEPILERGEESVSLDFAFHQREIKVRTKWQHPLIDLGATADKDFRTAADKRMFRQLAGVGNGFHTGNDQGGTGNDERLAKALPIESKVLRPMTMTWPVVIFLNHLKSSGRCQGILLPAPMTRLSDMAAMAW